MSHYVASYVPLVRETEVLRWEPNSQQKPTALKVEDAFKLLTALKERDHLWLMMGSTNAAVALAAFRKNVVVHQLSFPRIQAWLQNNGNEAQQDEPAAEEAQESTSRTKVKPGQVLQAAQKQPELFYPMSVGQAEVLEIVATWQRVSDAMEAREAAANLVRIRTQQDALLYGRALGKSIANKEELEAVLADQLKTKDERGRKRVPSNPHIAFLVEQEDRERSRLENLCKSSSFYLALFGDVKSVGPMLGARLITAVERIERFAKAKDLSNYAGMLPRGPEGKLPSRKRSKGKQLSRAPRLNGMAWLFQDQVFQWGRNSPLGQQLIQQVNKECPCTKKQREENKDLLLKHMAAVKRARVATTRYFFEKIVWPKWRAYMELTS